MHTRLSCFPSLLPLVVGGCFLLPGEKLACSVFFLGRSSLGGFGVRFPPIRSALRNGLGSRVDRPLWEVWYEEASGSTFLV